MIIVIGLVIVNRLICEALDIFIVIENPMLICHDALKLNWLVIVNVLLEEIKLRRNVQSFGPFEFDVVLLLLMDCKIPF